MPTIALGPRDANNVYPNGPSDAAFPLTMIWTRELGKKRRHPHPLFNTISHRNGRDGHRAIATAADITSPFKVENLEAAKKHLADRGCKVMDGQPQRNLTMIITTGGKMGFDGVPFLAVKFNFLLPSAKPFTSPTSIRTMGRPGIC